MRSSGILLPVFSLPSKYGIGCISKEAYEFVDFLKASGQSYWQILPIGQTSYGDSPYQSFSTFACNPYFIDLEKLIEQGLISEKDCDSLDFGNNEEYIDYEKMYESRYAILKKAFENFNALQDETFAKFRRTNKKWIEDYALFMAIKDQKNGLSWQEWEDELKLRKRKALAKYKEELASEIDFYVYLQFEFTNQWKELKKYANKNGIKIVGDIPIYVAEDSADAWSKPKLFQLDAKKSPVSVAGCPPDAFSETGQLWGNPLYNWDEHKRTKFAWWKDRIKKCSSLYDVIRIDHFRGFDEYYAIPFGNETAEFGNWEKGPNNELFEALSPYLGKIEIIAEDLGLITDTVRELVETTGFPNMKVLQFAFEPFGDSDYLPYNYDKNCVVYTGTHDNETTVGWYKNQPKKVKKFIFKYLNTEVKNLNSDKTANLACKELVRLAMLSPANTCIIPIQDYLCLDNCARINTPSTLGDNWKWRVKKDYLTKEKAKEIKKLTKISAR